MIHYFLFRGSQLNKLNCYAYVFTFNFSFHFLFPSDIFSADNKSYLVHSKTFEEEFKGFLGVQSQKTNFLAA